jgi:hypothetical protein
VNSWEYSGHYLTNDPGQSDMVRGLNLDGGGNLRSTNGIPVFFKDRLFSKMK